MPLTEQIAYMRRYDSDGLTTSLTDPELEPYLADASLFVPACRLGSRRDLAIALYALYLLSNSVPSSGGGGGSIRRQRVGDIEIEYATATTISTTGNKYLDLYKRLTGSLTRNAPIVLKGGNSC